MTHVVEVMSRDGRVSRVQMSVGDPSMVFEDQGVISLASRGPSSGNAVVRVRHGDGALVYVLSGGDGVVGERWKVTENNDAFDLIFDCAKGTPGVGKSKTTLSE